MAEHQVKPRPNTTCEAYSAQGRRCLKDPSHVMTETIPTHQAGPFVWSAVAKNWPAVADPSEIGQEWTAARVIIDETLGPTGVSLETELRGWWFDQAETEINATVPKAVEYSSTDLLDLGRTLAYIAGRTVDDEEAEELGVFFYLQGKMSRWAGAIKQGRRVSDDTLFDVGVYVRMAQRIRHSGSWPGVKESK